MSCGQLPSPVVPACQDHFRTHALRSAPWRERYFHCLRKGRKPSLQVSLMPSLPSRMPAHGLSKLVPGMVFCSSHTWRRTISLMICLFAMTLDDRIWRCYFACRQERESILLGHSGRHSLAWVQCRRRHWWSILARFARLIVPNLQFWTWSACLQDYWV